MPRRSAAEALGTRDAILRWIAKRRGIEVASMVADRRTEEAMFVDAQSGTADDDTGEIQVELVSAGTGR